MNVPDIEKIMEIMQVYPTVQEAVFCMEFVFQTSPQTVQDVAEAITSGERKIDGSTGFLALMESCWTDQLIQEKEDNIYYKSLPKAIIQLYSKEFRQYLNGRFGLV